MPTNSTAGDAHFADQRTTISFRRNSDNRFISISWPEFNKGKGVKASITLTNPPDHESMNIVIPIGKKRFYYNHKINCLPAEGFFQYGDVREEINPVESLGSLDWGRGVWDYHSFWN